MIQDIMPKKYYPDFKKTYPKLTDYVIFVKGREILMKQTDCGNLFTTFKDTVIAGFFEEDGHMEAAKWTGDVRRLFPHTRIIRTIEIDNEAYYIVDSEELFISNGRFVKDNIVYESSEILRHYQPMYMSYGVATAIQINRWMNSNRFCGKCASEMKPCETERAMVCENCGNMVFPKICPAVTISIIYKDKLLLVRNKSGVFHRFAQVAGYVEIGETFEDTVLREAMEETGMALKDIRYYKNQPWAMTDAQMIGYVATLDMEKMEELYGSEVLNEEYPSIRLQEEELFEGRWFSADEIPPDVADRSLTYEMIGNFRRDYIEKTGETGKYNEYSHMFDIGK